MDILTCLLLFFVVPSTGQNTFSNKIVLNNGIFNVSWNFNASLDTFEFLLEVRTTGWIGFGFALNAPTNMMNYDVAVGGVLDNGTTYLQVCITITKTWKHQIESSSIVSVVFTLNWLKKAKVFFTQIRPFTFGVTGYRKSNFHALSCGFLSETLSWLRSYQ